MFEWHFTIQGPPGTDYEGGRYHGRILLPPEYPMKPPSIVILTVREGEGEGEGEGERERERGRGRGRGGDEERQVNALVSLFLSPMDGLK